MNQLLNFNKSDFELLGITAGGHALCKTCVCHLSEVTVLIKKADYNKMLIGQTIHGAITTYKNGIFMLKTLQF